MAYPASYNRTFSRDDLLNLATRAFAENGFTDVSIRKLAAQAGVSDSLFIYHFGSKLKLWREAVDQMIKLEFPRLIARRIVGLDSTIILTPLVYLLQISSLTPFASICLKSEWCTLKLNSPLPFTD
jgi:AcrR family transcriptional regulator